MSQPVAERGGFLFFPPAGELGEQSAKTQTSLAKVRFCGGGARDPYH